MAEAKYKKKKKVKTQKGDEMVVYEYSDRQIANRNRQKAERLEKLRGSVDKLRAQTRKDLKSKDEKTRAVALAIALMDHTFERVGNDGSAEEGHFGVTTWQPKHVTFQKGKATIKYVGKSGVDQNKTVDDAALVKALKDACDGKKDTACIVEASASDVNEYLEPFGISAKDIRGFHANTEMKTQLKKFRKGKLPSDKKERETKLKEEFKKALEATAEAVGHEPTTLKGQYLVPGLEDQFLKDGTVTESHTKKGATQLEAVSEILFRGDVGQDTFVHFTPQSRADAILLDGCLRMRPPYKKFGTDNVTAVSLTYGAYVPEVQTTHTKTPANDPLVAVLFKTKVVPALGYVEEVIWRKDVFFVGKARIISKTKAIALLGQAPERIPEDAMVKYAGRKEKPDAEREDEQVQKMLRPEPKKKPPRYDLRDNRTLKERDKDLEGVGTSDGGDKDLQVDIRRQARRVAFRWLVLPTDPSAVRVALRLAAAPKGDRKGKSWEDGGEWHAQNRDGETRSFKSKEYAQAFASGADVEEEDPEDLEEDPEDPEDPEEDPKPKKPKPSKPKSQDPLADARRSTSQLIGPGSKIPEATQKSLEHALDSMTAEDLIEFSQAFQENMEELVQTDGFGEEGIAKANAASVITGDILDPIILAREAAEMVYAQNVVANPMILGGTPVSNEDLTTEYLAGRALESFKHYRQLDPSLREVAANRLKEELGRMDPKFPVVKELQHILTGLQTAAILEGQELPGSPAPSPKLVKLLKAMDEQGSLEELFAPVEKLTSPQSRKNLGKALQSMGDEDLIEQITGGDSKHPSNPIVEMLQDPEISEEIKKVLRDALIGIELDSMTWGDQALNDMGVKNPEMREKELLEIQQGPEYTELIQEFAEAAESGDILDPLKEDQTSLLDVLESNLDASLQAARAQGATYMDILKANLHASLLAARKADAEANKTSEAVAVLREYVRTGDPKVLESEVVEELKSDESSWLPSPTVDKTGSGSHFSGYTFAQISEGPDPLNNPSAPPHRRHSMPKLTEKGARQVTADLDRLATLFQSDYAILGIPEKIAVDMARRCDMLSDTIEKTAGLSRKAQMDPTENYTEEKILPNEFNPAEIGEEQSEAFLRNEDEPYMDVFKQDEFDQLREVQQDGMFSNAKSASKLIAKLADRLEKLDPKFPSQKKTKVAAESTEFEKLASVLVQALQGLQESKMAGKPEKGVNPFAEKSEEEEQEAEKDTNKSASQTGGHGYQLT